MIITETTNHESWNIIILVFFKNFTEQKYFNSHHVVGDTVPYFDLNDSYMHLILFWIYTYSGDKN